VKRGVARPRSPFGPPSRPNRPLHRPLCRSPHRSQVGGPRSKQHVPALPAEGPENGPARYNHHGQRAVPLSSPFKAADQRIDTDVSNRARTPPAANNAEQEGGCAAPPPGQSLQKLDESTDGRRGARKTDRRRCAAPDRVYGPAATPRPGLVALGRPAMEVRAKRADPIVSTQFPAIRARKARDSFLAIAPTPRGPHGPRARVSRLRPCWQQPVVYRSRSLWPAEPQIVRARKKLGRTTPLPAASIGENARVDLHRSRRARP